MLAFGLPSETGCDTPTWWADMIIHVLKLYLSS
jgi:hypothetical protein